MAWHDRSGFLFYITVHCEWSCWQPATCSIRDPGCFCLKVHLFLYPTGIWGKRESWESLRGILWVMPGSEINHLSIFHWPELNRMTTPSCKRGWEVWPNAVPRRKKKQLVSQLKISEQATCTKKKKKRKERQVGRRQPPGFHGILEGALFGPALMETTLQLQTRAALLSEISEK